MSEKLPATASLKLEQTLAQWEHWRGSEELPGAPHVVSVLAGGVSNYNVLVDAAGMKFSVRIDGVNPAANGLNRQAEWRALHAAHAAGIAPRPRYFNPDIGCLVCDYLPADEQASPGIVEFAELARRLHALPALHYRLDMNERIRRYQRHLDIAPPEHRTLLDSLREAGQTVMACAATDAGELCTCHNDLNPANLILSGGRLYALDWEYCAMGNPWFDLAVLVEGQQLTGRKSDRLLEFYLQRPVSERDQHLLLEQICVSRYIEILWYLSQKPTHLTPDALEQRLARLWERLEQLP